MKRAPIVYWMVITIAIILSLVTRFTVAQPDKKVVVIDPGHGGHSMGALGFYGVYEKYVTLQVAQRLGRFLEKRRDIEVVYTRTDDKFVGLKERAEIANQVDAQVFVSIHCNASTSPDVYGIETYYSGIGGEDTHADKVAEMENAGEALLDIDEDRILKGIVSNLQYNGTLKESAMFAEKIQTSLMKAFPETISRDVRQARFAVLRYAKMPAVVVEIGFITHEVEGRNILISGYQERIAKTIGEAIIEFLDGDAGASNNHILSKRHEK